jgi:hypothetical protein
MYWRVRVLRSWAARRRPSDPRPISRLPTPAGGLASRPEGLGARIACARPAEAHDDGVSCALRFCLARQIGVPRRQEFEVVEPDATQAGGPAILHHQQMPGLPTAMTFPVILERRDNHELGRTARLLDEACALLFAECRRDEVGAIVHFDAAVAALAEAQGRRAWLAGDIGGLARTKTVLDCPVAKEPHRLRYARQIGVQALLQVRNSSLPPSSERARR